MLSYEFIPKSWNCDVKFGVFHISCSILESNPRQTLASTTLPLTWPVAKFSFQIYKSESLERKFHDQDKQNKQTVLLVEENKQNIEQSKAWNFYDHLISTPTIKCAKKNFIKAFFLPFYRNLTPPPPPKNLI